jgi:hypothetical protein
LEAATVLRKETEIPEQYERGFHKH